MECHSNSPENLSNSCFSRSEKNYSLHLKFHIFQVFHAAFGLVRSNPMIVLIQILSRVFLVWGVANYISHVRKNRLQHSFFQSFSSLGSTFSWHSSCSNSMEYYRNHSLRLLCAKSISNISSMADMVSVSAFDTIFLSNIDLYALDTHFLPCFIHWVSPYDLCFELIFEYLSLIWTG